MADKKPLRTNIFGLPVDCIGMHGALDFVERSIDGGDTRQYILGVNPEKVIFLLNNIALRATFADASLLLPDGIGVVWAIRWLRRLHVDRLPASELMPKLCELAVKKNTGYFSLVRGKKSTKRQRRNYLNAIQGFRSLGGHTAIWGNGRCWRWLEGSTPSGWIFFL